MKNRTDKDSLGSVKIPSNAYYGPFTARAIKQYHVTGRTAHPNLIKSFVMIKRSAAIANDLIKFGRTAHPNLIKSFVMIKRSAAIANMKTKTINRKRGLAIVKACDSILKGKAQDQFVVDMINSGAGTAFNMNTNEVISNVALRVLGKRQGQYQFLHPNDHVNMSQSSNDTYPTAMHMAILFSLQNLIPEIEKLIKSLDRKAKKFSKFRKIGRTHLMDALPVTLGSEFSAYVTALTNTKDSILESKKQLEQVALGGTAVGTGANTPRGYRKIVIAELGKISKLNLKPEKDMQYSLQSKFPVTNVSSALKNFAIELGKVSNDIRLMASGPIAGISELGIPAVHAGSSIMPGKVNPSLAECMNMICFSVIGNDTTVSFSAQAGQFELNVMLPGMLKAVLDSTDMLTNFLPIFSANLVDGLTANQSKLRENIENSPVIVTLLAPKIGYQKSAELFKESLKTGKTIRELVVSKKLLTNKEVNSLLG